MHTYVKTNSFLKLKPLLVYHRIFTLVELCNYRKKKNENENDDYGTIVYWNNSIVRAKNCGTVNCSPRRKDTKKDSTDIISIHLYKEYVTVRKSSRHSFFFFATRDVFTSDIIRNVARLVLPFKLLFSIQFQVFIKNIGCVHQTKNNIKLK